MQTQAKIELKDKPWKAPKWFLPLTLVLIIGGCLGMAYVLYASLLGLAPHNPEGFNFVLFAPDGNSKPLFSSFKIFFVHLPSAMATMTLSIVMAIGAVLYLISKKRVWENLVVAAAQLGLVSCFIVMATGYFWGDYAWDGQGWNWEPRLTSALVLWLSYLALLVVREGMPDGNKRATFTAVYGLMTVPLYPLVSKSITLFGNKSHPVSLSEFGSSDAVNALRASSTPLLLMLFVGLLLLRFWQLQLSHETRRLARAIEDKEDDA